VEEEKDIKLESAYPDSLDWRTSGKVSPIQDQGDCGSCYAFAAANVLESRYAIKTGTLQKFSEQLFVDCS